MNLRPHDAPLASPWRRTAGLTGLTAAATTVDVLRSPFVAPPVSLNRMAQSPPGFGGPGFQGPLIAPGETIGPWNPPRGPGRLPGGIDVGWPLPPKGGGGVPGWTPWVPRMVRPPLTNPVTIDCLESILGYRPTAWPHTRCRAPVSEPRACVVPAPTSIPVTFRTGQQALDEVVEYATFFGSAFIADTPQRLQCEARAMDVVRMVLALLLDNLDIVEWSLCLIRELAQPESNWYPSQVTSFIDGGRRMNVWLINEFLNPEDPEDDNRPAGAAFAESVNPHPGGALGIIVPLGHTWWRCWVNSVADERAHAFEALVAAAGNVFHELLHVVLDQYPGGRHPTVCPDWVHMAETVFYWAMKTRYPCFDESSRCIANSGIGADNQFLFWENTALADQVDGTV